MFCYMLPDSIPTETGGSEMMELIPPSYLLALSSPLWPAPSPAQILPDIWCRQQRGVTRATAELTKMICEPWYLHMCGHEGPLWPGQPFSPNICWLIGNPNVQDRTGDQKLMCDPLQNFPHWKQGGCDTDFSSFQINLPKWSFLSIFWIKAPQHGPANGQGLKQGYLLFLQPFPTTIYSPLVCFLALSFVFLFIPYFPLPFLLFLLLSFHFSMPSIPRKILTVKF